MPLLLSIVAFLTIVVIVFAFGAAAVVPSSVLGSRLREIGWQRPKAAAETRHPRTHAAGPRSPQPRFAALAHRRFARPGSG